MSVDEALEKLRIAVAFAKQMLAAYEACKCLECRIAEGDCAEEGSSDTCTAGAVYDAANRHAVDSAILYLATLDAPRQRCQCQWEAGDSPCPVHGEHEEETP